MYIEEYCQTADIKNYDKVTFFEQNIVFATKQRSLVRECQVLLSWLSLPTNLHYKFCESPP